jgi:hypothetical protein
MFPKKSRMKRELQKLDGNLGKIAWKTYQTVLSKVLMDYPIELQNKVNGLLRAKDFAMLLEWVDTFEKASLAAKQESVACKRATSQLTALIKKYPFPQEDLAISARALAWKKFLLAEKRCRRYNLKYRRDRLLSRWEPHGDVLHRMSSYISHVLGFSPDMRLVFEGCGFGPGASIGVHGQTNLGRKLLAEKWTCTPSALRYVIPALAEDQHIWELLLPKRSDLICLDPLEFRKELANKVTFVNHNKIVFVPKTTLVDRTIAVEPLLNGYVQKGVDAYMRSLLKRVGIDLSDQSRNQRAAYLGSLDSVDPFVTIDLSSASDSISTDVVRRILPPDWFDLLNSLRSQYYELDGVVLPYNKFVSMGNGFCFPLETLIFASVCATFSKPGSFAVYGDDIVVRQSVSKQVLLTLRRLGFRHNPSKTFLDGTFRESCGADWVEGQDVRPLTLDKPLDTVQELVKFHNMSLRKDFWSDRFFSVREYLRELVPWEYRLCRPYKGEISGAFEVEMDMFQSSIASSWDRDVQAWKWLEVGSEGVGDNLPFRDSRYDTVLMMAAVRGSPSHKPFSTRRKTKQTVRVKSYAGAHSTWLPPTTTL